MDNAYFISKTFIQIPQYMYCNILMLQIKKEIHVVCKLPSLLIIKITATYTCKCNCIQ